MKREFVSATAAARIMHIGIRRFLEELHSGKIKLSYSRLGHKYIFKRKDVENYFEKSFTKVKNND